jgi:lipopolysaccharide biosynthesis glycosyltransferase
MTAFDRPSGATDLLADPSVVEVVVGCDDNYACHLGVMLLSLFAHCKTLPVRVHIMVPPGFASRAELEETLVSHVQRIKYNELADSAVLGLKQREDLTAATYYRLMMSDVLPSDMNRVIYIDCDMMLRCDLAELWRFPLGNAIAAAVADPGFTHNRTLGLPDLAPYFNAGLLLIDLEHWRSEAIGQDALAFARAYPDRLTFNDQCALNWVLRDRWAGLDPAWNVQTAALGRISDGAVEYFRPRPPIAADARIVHFNAPGRPWLYMDDHPFKSDYLAYRQRTPWRGQPPPDRYPHNVILKTLRRHAPALMPLYRRIREYV